jgi:hypothetical protein
MGYFCMVHANWNFNSSTHAFTMGSGRELQKKTTKLQRMTHPTNTVA